MTIERDPEWFVGRAAELAALDDRLTMAGDGFPQVVLIEGAIGIGKTALLDGFVDRARRRGAVALEARGDEAEAALPFGLVDQLWPRSDEPASADPLVRGAALVERLGDPAADLLVVAIDNAGWTDRASLSALTFAFRRLTGARLLLALATGDAAVDLPPGLIPLAQHRTGDRVRLAGFTTTEIRELARVSGIGAMSDRVVERLRATTEGNPLHLRVLFATLDRNALHDPREVLPDLPTTFDATTSARLGKTSPAGRQLAEAVMILGGSALLAEAAAVAQVDEPLDALDSCIAADLLTCRDQPAGRTVALTHPMVGPAVLHRLSIADRADLHRRAAAVSSDPRAALRHRIEASGHFDDELAGRASEVAANDQQRGAWESAAAWSMRAAGLFSRGAERESAALDAVQSLIVAGDLPAADALLKTTSVATARPRSNLLAGRLAAMTGDLAAGEALLRAAWADREPNDSRLGGMVASHLAAIELSRCHGDEAVAWARLAVEAGDPELGRIDIDPLSRLLFSLAVAGRVGEGAALIASRLATETDSGTAFDGDPVADGRFGRAIVRHLTGNLAGADADLAAVGDHSRTNGPFALWAFAQSWRSAVAFGAGRWDDAVRYALEATTAADTESWSFAAAGYSALAVPLAARGDTDAAADAIERGRGAVSAAGSPSLAAASVDGAEAWSALISGRPEHSIEVVGPWLDTPIATSACLASPPMLRMFVLASLRVGQVDAAAARLDAATPSVAGTTPWSLALRGLVSQGQGDLESAESGLRDALDQIDGDATPFDRGQLLLEAGLIARRRGQRRRAVAAIDEARDIFAQLGSRPLMDRCDEGRAKSGLSPRRRTNGPPELTPTEQVVAALVTRGLTNREIAAELVVSIKTVEFHLGNVYRKAGVTNRTQLARLAD